MKTIHDSINEMLELIEALKNSGLDITIMYKPQEILDVPYDLTESLVTGFLPRILELFQDENNLKEFEQWQESQKTIVNQTV